MTVEWVGKCHTCKKWRHKNSTNMIAQSKKNGKNTDFTLCCSICTSPIQRKCCENGCPHCAGTGMMPMPQSPIIICMLCDDPANVCRGGKYLCYGCEHEIFYKNADYELMSTLYGDD